MSTPNPAFARVTTARLLLRAVRDDDLDVIYQLHVDPETSRFDATGALTSMAEARELLARWQADWSREGLGYWMVERLDAPGLVVGVGGVRHKEIEGERVLNLAYRFSPRAWGQGYATEVARAALDLSARYVPDVPLVAIISPVNGPSLRVAQRLGLRLERVISYLGSDNGLYRVAGPGGVRPSGSGVI
ncbi:GNAT family N-acetyltransferase [Myxococcus sp. K15C18031901]|uniref:GNAT family N-acetyltransferase n=1 Tax=Myxococcus dinghuensis TaxID=2906761 RepID=UPI0020A73AFD|nr:GNAT family N-acetyltransferase [Myxococcus dinghuensis]MCP3103394.1 GNAT family N-acetyltransferase [Myxococcus dinghuensis]